MAKVRSNNAARSNNTPDNPNNPPATFQRGNTYSDEANAKLRTETGDDAREIAAIKKQDIQGRDMPKRYSTGTEGYKEAKRQSEENITRKAVMNRLHGDTSGPGTNAVKRNIEDKEDTSPDKLKALTEAQKRQRAAEEARRRSEELMNPTFVPRTRVRSNNNQ
jgi:hypothetical protein